MVMYNHKHKVNYRDNSSDDAFRQDLLAVFGFESFDDDGINERIRAVYAKVGSELKEVIDFVVANHQMPFHLEGSMAFTFLFSWEYFDLLHACLAKSFEGEDSSPEVAKLLYALQETLRDK